MLPEWADPEKALSRLEKILIERGLAEGANGAVAANERRYAHLPGFTIFDRGQDVSPYQWCVPRPRGDETDVLNAYEEYVDRNLGGVPNPGKVALGAVRKGLGRAYFGAKRTPGRWRVPLAKLIAVSQHFAEEPVRLAGDSVSVDLGVWRMECTSRQAWSNLHNRQVVAKRPAVDIGLNELRVEPLRTAHPLAGFLEGKVGDDVLWLANTVVCGHREGRLASVEFREDVLPRGNPGRPRAMPIERIGAALALKEIIEGPAFEGQIHEMYRAAVPALMKAHDFYKTFGNPHDRRLENRKMSPATQAKYIDLIDQIVEDERCNRA